MNIDLLVLVGLSRSSVSSKTRSRRKDPSRLRRRGLIPDFLFTHEGRPWVRFSLFFFSYLSHLWVSGGVPPRPGLTLQMRYLSSSVTRLLDDYSPLVPRPELIRPERDKEGDLSLEELRRHLTTVRTGGPPLSHSLVSPRSRNRSTTKVGHLILKTSPLLHVRTGH